MQVSSNGILSFDYPFFEYTPRPFPLFSRTILIAPFWNDIITVRTGWIMYRYSEVEDLLAKVGTSVNSTFEDVFHPVLLFIATWFRVPPFGVSLDIVSKHCDG